MSVEIDLHGHSVAEALARFTHAYNAAVAAGGAAEIRVVHGHGASGGTSKIRVRLRELLAEHADRLDFRPGEACVDPNPGLTIVYPRQPFRTRSSGSATPSSRTASRPRPATRSSSASGNTASRASSKRSRPSGAAAGWLSA